MRKKGRALILAGLLLFAGALGLTAFNLADALRAKQTAETMLITIEEMIDEGDPELPEEPIDPDAEAAPEMPAVEIDGSRYVGVIEVPSVSVSLPVFADWSYDLLKKAPCRYSGSCYTNDLVICAHNYRGHFGALTRASIGDEVFFTSVSGSTYRYVVSNRETLRPTENDRMITAGGDWDLTLFTCFVGGRTRCTLRCVLSDD
jgi:sortase A